MDDRRGLRDMEQTPEELAEDLLSRLRMGGIWEPAGMGLTYMRTGEKEIELMAQENTSHAAQARIRMGILVSGLGWQVKEDKVQINDVVNQDPFQRHMEEMVRRQEIAQTTWKCQTPDCGCLLVAFPLEERKWVFHGEEEYQLPDGNVVAEERWTVDVTCPICDSVAPMDPYEFGLIAGDELMNEFVLPEVTYNAVERPRVIELTDKRSNNLIISGTVCPFTGATMPPHLRGIPLMFTATTGEEE
tara:strand:- start:1279 stop:2013 length:735 start_codon:yes stop_codon:yes gene_type:complete